MSECRRFLNVLCGLLEVPPQEVVDRAFEHERVVHGDRAYFIWLLDTIPARLSTTRHRGVHHVVRDEEEGLELIMDQSKLHSLAAGN